MKLLCKKTPNIGTQTINMIPGKYYLVINNINLIEDDDGYSWYFTDKYIDDYLLYIWDYFYTPQEERKIKLQKLNETTL